ncbi:porin [Undibacterium arcticum]
MYEEAKTWATVSRRPLPSRDFFRADTGESGRGNTDTFFQRQSWVGVSDDRLGTLRLGRLPTPNWLTTIKFGPFGGASVTPFVMHTYLPSALQPMMTGSGASDASWANSIGYISPRWSGFTGMAVYALSEGSANGKRLGASLGYDAGPLAASIAFEKAKPNVIAIRRTCCPAYYGSPAKLCRDR